MDNTSMDRCKFFDEKLAKLFVTLEECVLDARNPTGEF